MVKEFLFDADGVIIKKGKYKYFSERLSQEHGIPLEQILPFFQGEYRLCATGQADLKEILPTYLDKWGWQGSLDDFLEYWFSNDCEIDQELATAIQELRSKGLIVCLATNNEKYRAEYLLKVAGLEKVFDSAFVSAYIRHKKPSREFFEEVMKKSPGIEKQEVVFYDSDQEIVDGANEFGIQGRLYTDFENFKRSNS